MNEEVVIEVVNWLKSLGVSERTIQRDLEDLQAHPWYLPLLQDESWYWRLDSKKTIPLPPVSLARNEAAALFLGARLLTQYSGRLSKIADAAVVKLAKALPTEIGNFLLLNASKVSTEIDPQLSHATVEVFQTIVTGWIERRKVICVHQTLGGYISSYNLAPYTFETSAVGYAVYVRGHCDEDGDKLPLRTLKLDRIRQAVLSDDIFEYDKAFSDTDLATAWRVWGAEEAAAVKIHLRFSKAVSARVKESVWHPSQRIIDLSQGGCEWLAFVAEPKEMLPWIRGWGAECEVIAPEEVRKLLVSETQRLSKLYDTGVAVANQLDSTAQAGSGYYAHSLNRQGKRHDLVAHLEGVAQRAAQFTTSFGASELAYYSGLWHDLGKFNPAWQKYLLDAEKGNVASKKIDHKAAGSLVMLGQPGVEELAMLIQGHHGGLQDRDGFKAWFNERKADPATNAAVEIARRVMPKLVPEQKIAYPAWLSGVKNKRLAGEFFLRMVFSALVDADRLDTEAHANEQSVLLREGRAEMGELWQKLEQSQLKMFSQVPDSLLNQDRRRIYEACVAAAQLPTGPFRLTVPTGGGKTRSGLAFALKHALHHHLKQIVVALPFTTITEQTADIYRSIFEADRQNQGYGPVVLEHHSAYVDKIEDDKEGNFHPDAIWHKLATENWDAPVIVTTTVQLLESLFSNHTGKCRKLHRLANSVIILDEAQALPIHLLQPILSGLRELIENYGTTIVFSTATQPTFEAIPQFKDLAATEIVPEPSRFFANLKRVDYDWRLDQPLEWSEVAELMRHENQALAIVNTKKDALALAQALEGESVLYLSTNLCGSHRRQTIAEIKRRLKAGEKCLVVSTQLIEAGVDLDFPLVLRALAPVDSLIQAAGRCNREGKLATGRVIIFVPKEGTSPRDIYKTATNLSRTIFDLGFSDLNDPQASQEYFRQLYNVQKESLDKKEINSLREKFNYPEVAKEFQMIEDNTESVVVKFGTPQERAEVAVILEDLRAGSTMARYLLRQLQPYLVSIYHHKIKGYTEAGLIESIVPGLGLWHGEYHPRYGLMAQDTSPDTFIIG